MALIFNISAHDQVKELGILYNQFTLAKFYFNYLGTRYKIAKTTMGNENASSASESEDSQPDYRDPDPDICGIDFISSPDSPYSWAPPSVK